MYRDHFRRNPGGPAKNFARWGGRSAVEGGGGPRPGGGGQRELGVCGNISRWRRPWAYCRKGARGRFRHGGGRVGGRGRAREGSAAALRRRRKQRFATSVGGVASQVGSVVRRASRPSPMVDPRLEMARHRRLSRSERDWGGVVGGCARCGFVLLHGHAPPPSHAPSWAVRPSQGQPVVPWPRHTSGPRRLVRHGRREGRVSAGNGVVAAPLGLRRGPRREASYAVPLALAAALVLAMLLLSTACSSVGRKNDSGARAGVLVPTKRRRPRR
jgi:hypothetical protein